MYCLFAVLTHYKYSKFTPQCRTILRDRCIFNQVLWFYFHLPLPTQCFCLAIETSHNIQGCQWRGGSYKVIEQFPLHFRRPTATIACEQAHVEDSRVQSRANGMNRERSGEEGVCMGACRHSIDAAVPWYQLLVSRSDGLNRWLLTALR